MCQYFASDYEPLVENTRVPIDIATRQMTELLENGPVLDYLRVPYQFHQLEGQEQSVRWLEVREQEVRSNRRRMEEIAQQERVGVACGCES